MRKLRVVLAVMSLSLTAPLCTGQWPQMQAPYGQPPATAYPAAPGYAYPPGYGYPPVYGYPNPMPMAPQQPMPYPPQAGYSGQPMYVANRQSMQPGYPQSPQQGYPQGYPQAAYPYPAPQQYPPPAWNYPPQQTYSLNQNMPPFQFQPPEPNRADDLHQVKMAARKGDEIINAESGENSVVAGPKSHLPNASSPLNLQQRLQGSGNNWMRSMWSTTAGRLFNKKNAEETAKAK